MTAASLYQTAGWRKLAKQRKDMARDHDEPCIRCGRAIDYTLPSQHKLGATIDHLDAVGLGGATLPPLADLAPAHRSCNSRHGGQLGQALRRGTTHPTPPPTPSTRRNESSKPTTITQESKPDRTRSFSDTPNSPLTGDRFRSGWVGGDLLQPPRVVTPPHPNAVGSLGPAWIAWAEGSLVNPKTRKLWQARPFQRFVFERGLEVDAAGRLCWFEVDVSGPRQIGKSWIEWALAAARAEHAGYFGEQQRILQVANKLRAAHRIHKMAWPWAAGLGYHVSRSLDSPTITWPDGSAWLVSSLSAAWGETATLGMVDESWDVEPEVVEDAITPTLLDPEQSQLWQFSTANREATATYPRARRRATVGGGDGRTLVIEWSAAPDADPLDPVTWRQASPHWTAEREAFMATKSRQPGFAEQYLNQWPNVGDAVAGWPAGWGELDRTPGEPRAGLLGAIECAPDRTRFGVAVAELVGGRVAVWTRSASSLDGAVAQLRLWSPRVLLCGVTMAGDVTGSWQLEPVGLKETGWATPRFEDLVRRGVLVHDHDAGMLREVETARTSLTEGGPVLSARRSEGPVPTVKAALWASWAVVDGRFAPVEAEIW